MRFNVRTLLLTLAGLAVLLSVAEFATRGYRERLRIRSDLRSAGAYYVALDDRNQLDYVGFIAPVRDSRISSYRTINHLDLAGAHVTDDSIRHIAALKRIGVLHLTDCDITDAHLALLADSCIVAILRLNDCRVTDDAIPYIASINGLRSVDLTGTLISADGITQLNQRCPGIVIVHDTQ